MKWMKNNGRKERKLSLEN